MMFGKILEKNKRPMGVRVPIDEPLDYGQFPTSNLPKAKELLSDADNIVGRCRKSIFVTFFDVKISFEKLFSLNPCGVS